VGQDGREGRTWGHVTAIQREEGGELGPWPPVGPAWQDGPARERVSAAEGGRACYCHLGQDVGKGERGGRHRPRPWAGGKREVFLYLFFFFVFKAIL